MSISGSVLTIFTGLPFSEMGLSQDTISHTIKETTNCIIYQEYRESLPLYSIFERIPTSVMIEVPFLKRNPRHDKVYLALIQPRSGKAELHAPFLLMLQAFTWFASLLSPSCAVT